MDRKVTIVLIIIGAVVAGLLIYSYWKGGNVGLFNALTVFVKLFFWVLVLAIIGGVIYFLFIYEKKINASLEVMKDINSECKINKKYNLDSLWVSGDKKHTPKKIGKIVGFSVRQSYDTIKKGNKNCYVNESVFKVRRAFNSPFVNIIAFLFSKRIFVRCPQYMHDDLQGDVYISSVSLVKHGFYYYPSNLHLNVNAIDKTIFNESLRYIQLDLIRPAHNLISKGMGVTFFDKKELEGEKGMDIVRREKGNIIPRKENS